MQITQNALVNHITNSSLFPSVKPYAGELKEVGKLTQKLPAAFVLFRQDDSEDYELEFAFSILVITKSSLYDKTARQTQNLSTAQGLINWLLDNMLFKDSGYTINMEFDQPRAETIVVDPRVNVIEIKLTVSRDWI